MVLEHLFPEDWLEKKVRYGFLIAVIYATIGIVVARLLFGANSGIVSVVFTSLLILPYLQKMFKKEEKEEEKEHKISFRHPSSLIDFFKNNQAIRVYFSVFVGIYLTYMLYSYNPYLFIMEYPSVFSKSLSAFILFRLSKSLKINSFVFSLYPTSNIK